MNATFSTNSLVLCDSWSGHKDEQVLLEAFGGKCVDLKIIPPKTTISAPTSGRGFIQAIYKNMPRE